MNRLTPCFLSIVPVFLTFSERLFHPSLSNVRGEYVQFVHDPRNLCPSAVADFACDIIVTCDYSFQSVIDEGRAVHILPDGLHLVCVPSASSSLSRFGFDLSAEKK